MMKHQRSAVTAADDTAPGTTRARTMQRPTPPAIFTRNRCHACPEGLKAFGHAFVEPVPLSPATVIDADGEGVCVATPKPQVEHKVLFAESDDDLASKRAHDPILDAEEEICSVSLELFADSDEDLALERAHAPVLDAEGGGR